MTKSEVKTFMKTYEVILSRCCSSFPQVLLVVQRTTPVQRGQLTSPGETILYDVPATGELGQEPGQKQESLSH